MTRETPELQPLDDSTEGIPMDLRALVSQDGNRSGKGQKAHRKPSEDPVADLRSYLSKIDR